MNNNFATLDYIVFGLYALIILGVGLWVSRNKDGVEKSSEDYFLASDLEMFIRISRCKKLKNILFLNETFANVASGGISSKLLIKKYLEVTKIYFQYYGLFFFIPLLLRYLRKSISIIRCISKNI